MTNEELAKKLARELMACGDESTPAQRMQYMGGTYPDHEIDQGGMNERALQSFFEDRLNFHLGVKP